MDDDVRALIERYELRPLPVEGTLFAQTYRSSASTAIVGLYCAEPQSRSCFHRLVHDEVWHAYAGDPFRLVLLHPDGSSVEIVMGRGHEVQFTVPAGTWQAGELLPGGRYALFGCTMAPGFTPAASRRAPPARCSPAGRPAPPTSGGLRFPTAPSCGCPRGPSSGRTRRTNAHLSRRVTRAALLTFLWF